jgi:hypothetical protein
MNSTSNLQLIPCPRCGAEVKADIVSVIVPDDAKTMGALFAGRLNCPLCPSCKQRFAVSTPLVYRDVERACIITQMEAPEDGNTLEMEQELDCLATDMAVEQGIARPFVRLTTSRPDFLEKISLFQAGLDDRLIEYAKSQLFRNIDESRLSIRRHRLLYDFTNRDESKLIFFVYDKEVERNVTAVHVPMEDFRTLEREFAASDELRIELDSLFPSCVVSVERLIS